MISVDLTILNDKMPLNRMSLHQIVTDGVFKVLNYP